MGATNLLLLSFNIIIIIVFIIIVWGVECFRPLDAMSFNLNPDQLIRNGADYPVADVAILIVIKVN